MTPDLKDLSVFQVVKFRGQARVTEYLCQATGEIIDAETVTSLGSKAVRPHAMLSRERKLKSLRKEPQRFARYLLRYRNGRCGFQLPLDDLVGMYAKLNDQEAKNVRRYLPALSEAGILVDDRTLHKDFMVNNPVEARAAAVGDAERASCRFAIDRLSYQRARRN